MAPTHSIVERNGSQMNLFQDILTQWLLTTNAPCQLRVSATGKPIGMRGCCSLLTFPQPYLQTRVATETGLCSCFRVCGFSWCPPRDANNCDGCNQRWVVVTATCINSQLLPNIKCTWAPTKRQSSPAEAVLVEGWVALPGFSEIL